MKIVYNFDTWDAATVTASSEASSDLAAENVLTKSPSEPWRATGDTAEWLKFDLGAQTALTGIGLFGFNLTSGATVVLEGNATDSWGSPSFQETLSLATDSDSVVLKRLVYFPSTFDHRWARITFADAGNSDGYLEVGRICAGTAYEPPTNYRDGYRIQGFDPSEKTQDPGAYNEANTKDPYRRATLSFAYTNQTQADKFWTIFNKIGNHTPALIALNPSTRPTKDSMYANLITPLSEVNRWSLVSDFLTLVFEEKTR